MHPKRLTKIASFELVRLFLSKRGLLALAAFSICWLLILRYPVAESVSLLSSPEFAGFFDGVFGAIGLSKLLTWPESELAVYWLIALYSFPTFCLFLCSDQTVGDKQRGTLRFLSLRATRSEILLGRFLGQVIILAVLILLTIMATIAVLGYREPALISAALLRAGALFGYLVISVMPFIALMTFLNTFAGSARLAFVFAILFFGGGSIIVGLLSWKFLILENLNFIFPGYQLELLAGQNASLWMALGLPILQTLVLLLFAQRVFARSAL